MPSVGFAVDAASAGGMWGWSITILLVLLFGAVSALGFVVKKLYTVMVGDIQKRLPQLISDMEALTESLVPKDEKGRAIRLKLAEDAIKHYRDHDRLMGITVERGDFVDKMQAIANQLDEKIDFIYKVEKEKKSGEYWKQCAVSQCPPLKAISSNMEEARETLEEMGKLLDEQSIGVKATREELHKALEESYSKFYEFLMGISKSMLDTFRESSTRDGQ